MAGYADIGIYDHQSVGDIVDSLNRNTQFETEQTDRADALRRKLALNNIFSKHIDDKGNLNERSFYAEASKAGLDPNQIGQAIDYHNKQIDQMSKIATEQSTQRIQGYDPTSAGRNEAGFGSPDAGSIILGMVKTSSPSSEGNGAPDGPTTIDADKLRDPEVVRAEAEAKANGISPVAPTTPTEAPIAPVKTALDRMREKLSGSKQDIKEVQRELGVKADGVVGKDTRTALNRLQAIRAKEAEEAGTFATEQGGQVAITAPFQSKGEEARMAPDTVGPDVFEPAPEDNRTFTQKFEDSYNPANSIAGQSGASNLGTPNESLFTWEPKNDGSNAFMQYATALDSRLKGNGFKDASDFLHQIYAQEIKRNMPTAPNEGLLQLGKEGIAKYRGEQRAYQAGLQKAQGAAEDAVTKAREGLAEFAKTFGVNTVEQRKTELSDTEILRDPSKRTEAASLKTNFDNITHAKDIVRDAGTNTSKLMLAYPVVVRAYATALNPGQQLSEGNLSEAAKSLFPDQTNNKEFMIKAIGGLVRGLKNDDWSVFNQLVDYVDAGAPSAMANRLRSMANAAGDLNAKSYGSYVINGKGNIGDKLGSVNDKTKTDISEPIQDKAEGAGKALRAKAKKAVTTHKEGDTWSDKSYNYRYHNGKIQRKAK